MMVPVCHLQSMHLQALIDRFETLAAELRRQGTDYIATHVEHAAADLRRKQCEDQQWIDLARPESLRHCGSDGLRP